MTIWPPARIHLLAIHVGPVTPTVSAKVSIIGFHFAFEAFFGPLDGVGRDLAIVVENIIMIGIDIANLPGIPFRVNSPADKRTRRYGKPAVIVQIQREDDDIFLFREQFLQIVNGECIQHIIEEPPAIAELLLRRGLLQLPAWFGFAEHRSDIVAGV